MARGSSLLRSRHGVKRIVLRVSRANAIDHNARSSDPLRPRFALAELFRLEQQSFQINSVLPSEEVNSEQIGDVLAMFSEMGVNVVEIEDASEDEEQREEREEEAEAESSELVEVQRAVPAKSEAKEPTERTDDPVRMYLREMGSVELLSREGEIAIAKRIEAGREAMIAGLCESALTFQAIIIWRDELNEGKVFLRDIIDLEATYAGPDAKAMPGPVIGPDGQVSLLVLSSVQPINLGLWSSCHPSHGDSSPGA
jgi:hypothetical protein